MGLLQYYIYNVDDVQINNQYHRQPKELPSLQVVKVLSRHATSLPPPGDKLRPVPLPCHPTPSRSFHTQSHRLCWGVPFQVCGSLYSVTYQIKGLVLVLVLVRCLKGAVGPPGLPTFLGERIPLRLGRRRPVSYRRRSVRLYTCDASLEA